MSTRYRAWTAGQVAPTADDLPAPPPTLERARAAATLSRLMLDHELVRLAGDSHETAVEIARSQMMPLLDAIVMTATGAIHAWAARPDLFASASLDAGKAQALAIGASVAATWPLGKLVAAAMQGAASTALALSIELSKLPGRVPTMPPRPGAPFPGGGPPVASRDGDDVADDDDDELAPSGAQRRSRGGAGMAIGAAAALGTILLLARR
jgi:hypothetical protein